MSIGSSGIGKAKNGARKWSRSPPQLQVTAQRMNLRVLSKMRRPSRTAATMVVKLSSSSTTYAASRATSVPVMPMATPMSARLSAGA
jgi:hypothetical protein